MVGHKGARLPNGDYFDEFFEADADHGVLQGAGIDDHDRVKQKLTQEGLATRVNCRFCNSPKVVIIEWHEMFVIGSNTQFPGQPPVLPQNWHYSPNNSTAYLQMPCRCGNPGITVHTTPDECASVVKQGEHAGFVHRQQLQQWAQSIRAQRGV